MDRSPPVTGSPSDSADDRVVSAAAALLARHPRVVLAVSGGSDSMALLHAAVLAARADGRRLVAATFDHGTGIAAREGVALVRESADALGLRVLVGGASLAGAGEAAWREARWQFLRQVARVEGAPVATAHTEDDQLETVVFRALRGAGARGLAGLAAPSPVERPFLHLSGTVVRAWVRARGVRWIEDPSNGSPRFARNRLRHDLLPAIVRADPGFRATMLDLGRRAAAWRAGVEEVASAFVQDARDGCLRVAASALATYDSDMLAVLWPALAARAGVTLDWRGLRRLTGFTRCAPFGAVIPLSGGFEVIRDHDSFVLRRAIPREVADGTLPLEGDVALGGWHFAPADLPLPADLWSAELPADVPLSVRAWRDGDRLVVAAGGRARRVKRFLADARVPAPDRAGWPVVLAGRDIVWIPGVRAPRASGAGTARPMVTYVCRRAAS